MAVSAHPSIFTYSDPRQFMVDRFAAFKSEEPGLSVRAWASEMGLKSHSVLTMFMKGSRPMRPRHVPSLARGLRLSPQETLFLQALVQFKCARGEGDRTVAAGVLNELNPQPLVPHRELEEFHLVSHWVHMLLMAALELKRPPRTAREFHQSLGAPFRAEITVNQIAVALDRLVTLELAVRKKDGTYGPGPLAVTTKNDRMNNGARQYYRQVLALAEKSIEGVAMERREFQCFTLAVPRSALPKAKDMLRRFRRQLTRELATAPGEEVIQICLNLFQVTDNFKEKS